VILYLDASAAVKRYVTEPGTAEVHQAMEASSIVGTGLISRAEIAAALAKAARMGVLLPDEAEAALEAFRVEWPDYIRIQITEALVARADSLAWQHGLRGYDAVHLATALTWQDGMGEPVTLATFDRRLWESARQSGLLVFPDDLPAMLHRAFRKKS
jgi:predicted nucleic acid-binding protein